MKQTLLVATFFFFTHILTGQVIYISSSTNGIYRLNLDNCTYTFVVQVNRQIYDIAFHPDGSLYGISGNGNFFSIDTLTGVTTILNSFGGQSFNSLTIGSDGLVYTIGNDGELWTYNLLTGVAIYVGDIGFDATGDLTFYKGQLYVAATGDRIVRIDVNSVQNSSVIINDNIPGNILGIVSDVVNCTEINCYAISNGMSAIYKINFQTQSLELTCQLNITIGGGASTSEFLASSPLQIDTAMVSNPDCLNQNGAATVEASGGTGPYSYSLNGGPVQFSNSFTGLPDGSYSIIVSDQMGCEDTLIFELTIPDPPTIDTIIEHPATCGLNNGSITAMVSGGVPAYAYSLNGHMAQASNLFSSLAGGTYSLHIIDEQGCRDSISFDLDMYSAPGLDSLLVDSCTCHKDNGAVRAFASGGNGQILYSLDSLVFQATGVFSDLTAGRYTVYIVDSANCVLTEDVLIDTIEPAAITNVNLAHTSCGENNGSLMIQVSSNLHVEYTLNSPAFQPQWAYTGLPPGPKQVVIRDENGCLDSLLVFIDPSISPRIDEIVVQPASCSQSNGTLSIEGTGGAGVLQYSINGSTYQSSNRFTNLQAGIYPVYILDEAGCTVMAETEIPSPGNIAINSIITSASECLQNTGILNLMVEGGVEPYTFSINNQLPQEEAQFTQLDAGAYHIHITDASGCQLDSMVTIEKIPCPVYIPNIFSPNGDGINDVFQIQTPPDNEVLITRFYIFDRWGNNVYQRYYLPIHSNEGWWDGKYKRFTMNPGVFAYYLEVEFENGQREIYKGNVTLIR